MTAAARTRTPTRTPARTGRPRRDDGAEVLALRVLAGAGFWQAAAAREAGLSFDRVSVLAARHGIRFAPAPAAMLAVVARASDPPDRAVRGGTETPAEVALLRALAGEGRSKKAVARVFGRSEWWVRAVAARHGIGFGGVVPPRPRTAPRGTAVDPGTLTLQLPPDLRAWLAEDCPEGRCLAGWAVVCLQDLRALSQRRGAA